MSQVCVIIVILKAFQGFLNESPWNMSILQCAHWSNFSELVVGGPGEHVSTPTFPVPPPPPRGGGGGISSSVLSVFFTDKFALSQSDARISVAYKICQWKTLTKHLMKCPTGSPHKKQMWIRMDKGKLMAPQKSKTSSAPPPPPPLDWKNPTSATNG